MKVTIVTVTFNSEETIVNCIESVNNQTYDNIEHIIVDGSSRDCTLELIMSVPNRVTKIISEPDKGIYDAMNKGVSIATGEIIGILNSDDFYSDENVIQSIVNIFISDPELSIVYGDLNYVKQRDVNSIVRIWNSSEYHPRFFENGKVPPHPSVFLKTDVYLKAGVFDLSFTLAADYEYLLRIFKKYNFKSFYYPAVLVKMRYGGASNKNIWNIIIQNREIMRSWHKNDLKIPYTFFLLKFYRRFIQFIR